jgi:hypothetical protein
MVTSDRFIIFINITPKEKSLRSTDLRDEFTSRYHPGYFPGGKSLIGLKQALSL